MRHRRTDEQLLRDLVPLHGAIGNQMLRKQLPGWSDEKFWKVRKKLIDQEELVPGKGKGGALRRSALPVLKHVRFRDWKSFHDASLYIDPLTVLIGTNASGKSNALDGLLFLNRTAQGKPLEAALGGDPTLQPLRGGLEWASLKGKSQFTIEVAVEIEEGAVQVEYVYSISVETLPRVQLLEESLRRRRQSEVVSLFETNRVDRDDPSILARIYNGKGRTRFDAHRNASLLSQLESQPLPQDVILGVKHVARVLHEIFVLDPIPSGMRGYSPLAESLRSDAANIAGVLAALPRKQKRDIELTITRYIRGLPERDVLKVWAEPVGRFEADAMLYCEEAWVPRRPTTVDARGMSDGTLRMLAILTALLTRPAGSILVIEEVDNGLHPSRAHLLLRMLRELGGQRRIDVLVTTHNPALLDALGPEMVPFVIVAHRHPKKGYSQLALLEDIQALAKLFAGGTLGTLSAQGKIERSLRTEEMSA